MIQLGNTKDPLFLTRVKEQLEVWGGSRGALDDSLVTFGNMHNSSFINSLSEYNTPITGVHPSSGMSGDTIGPNQPTTLAVTAGTFQNVLTWVNPTDSDLYYIEVWMVAVTAGAAAPAVSTSSRLGIIGQDTTPVEQYVHVDIDLQKDYYYWVRAVDFAGNYSGWANTTKAVGASVESTISKLMDMLKGASPANYAAGTTYYEDDQVYYVTDGKNYICIADGGGAGITGVVPTTTANWKRHGFLVTGDVDSISVIGVDGNMVVDGTVLARSISVTNLSAINADMGTITAGSITLDNSGYIQTVGKTSYADTDAGFWLGYDSAYKLNIGDATEYLKWDGSNLTIAGSVTITSGGVPWSLITDDGNQPEDNADVTDATNVGAQFTNTLATIDAQTDRAELGFDASGNVITKVVPVSNAAPSGAGLYLGADYMGYYTGSAWRSYIDNAANVYFGDGSNEYFQYSTAGGVQISSAKENAITLLGGGDLKLVGHDSDPSNLLLSGSSYESKIGTNTAGSAAFFTPLTTDVISLSVGSLFSPWGSQKWDNISFVAKTSMNFYVGGTALAIDASQNHTFSGDIHQGDSLQHYFGTNDDAHIYYDASNYLTITTTTAAGIYFATTGTTRAQVSAAGNFQPWADSTYTNGTSSKCWLNIYGDAGVTSCSDKKWKINIVESPLGLDFIDRLDIVQWEWDKSKGKTLSKKFHGILAQDVLSVIEDMGLSNDDFAGVEVDEVLDNKDKKIGENWGFRYEQLIGPLCKAVQELKQEVELLKAA